MIMRVGGRFPYLQAPESVFAVQAKRRGRYVAMCVCVSSLNLSVCVRTCVQAQGVETFDGLVDVESKHNSKQFHQPMLAQ